MVSKISDLYFKVYVIDEAQTGHLMAKLQTLWLELVTSDQCGLSQI